MRIQSMTLAAAVVGLAVLLGACGGNTSSSTSSDSGSGPSEDSAAKAAVDYGKMLLQDVGSTADVEVTEVQLDGDSAVVYIEMPSDGAGARR